MSMWRLGARLVGVITLVVCMGGIPSQAAAELAFEAQEGDGRAFVLVSGDFSSDDDLSKFSVLVHRSRPDFVTFDSPGGNLAKAIELGRLIRAAGLNTVQIRQLECASACAFAYFGGHQRFAAPGAIGMHKASLDKDVPLGPDEATHSVQELMAIVMGYMTEMGVDIALLELILRYDADDIRYLSGAEMARYNVTTNFAALPDHEPAKPVSRGTANEASNPYFIPEARSGKIRHPKGSAPLKSWAAEDAPDLAVIPNGTPFSILTNKDRWYGLRINGTSGYVHHSWVFVDQFEHASFEDRYIQIKSFSNYDNAEQYVRSSPLRVAARLATNGWFAITLEDAMEAATAANLLKNLKVEGRIPADSYITYGNTYVRKVCCD